MHLPSSFGKKPATSLLSVAAAAAVTSLALAGCGGQPRSADAGPDLHQVYARAEKSLRSGGIYHERTTEKENAGAYSYTSTGQLWVDVKNGTARQESVSINTGGHVGQQPVKTVTLISNGVNWVDGQPQSTRTCPGVDPVTSLVLGCLVPGDDAKPSTIEAGTYHGKSVTVLVTDTSFVGEDETMKTTRHAYLDTDSALPIAARVDGTIDDGTVAPLHRVVGYHAEFLPAGSLPADFFSPTSLSWHLPDPEANLPPGVSVYWLGREFHPGGDLPALTLSRVEKGSPDLYAAVLGYAPLSAPYGPPMLMIMVMTPEQFHDPHRVPTPMRCVGPRISLAGAHTSMNCSKTFSTRARVELPDAVLEISATAGAGGPGGLKESPYMSHEAIAAVLRSLTLRTP